MLAARNHIAERKRGLAVVVVEEGVVKSENSVLLLLLRFGAERERERESGGGSGGGGGLVARGVAGQPPGRVSVL